jgi:alpha-L-rhamnosidase
MNWTARFIAPDLAYDGAPLLRRDFTLATGHGSVEKAVMFVSALGICEPTLNGVPVSNQLLTPGWTSYEWRIRYAEHDVTGLLSSAENTLGIGLGNGWYRGRLAWEGGSGYYGDELAAFGELRIDFADGFQQIIATDEAWQAGASAITANDLYDGQNIDARRHPTGWNEPGFESSSWSGVHIVQTDLDLLDTYLAPPVTRQDERLPERIWESPSGAVLLDYGQNLVGWLRMRVSGDAGATVTVKHAEVLEDNELGIRPLRTAKATDHFTLSGGDDLFEPTLTFHGFRYVQVDGWPGGIEALRPESMVAVVVSSELRRTGHFASSNPELNQLHNNVVWGMRGNFVDVPTDCPQRDERLGWTGDIAAFAPSAAFLYDSKNFLGDWLIDVALEQEHQDGIVPFVVPDILKMVGIPNVFEPLNSTAIWSDAAVWVPWALWEAYGDQSVLERQYPSMTAHVRRVASLLSPTGLWDSGFQFGDWLDPDAPPERPDAAKADPSVVATACAFRSATMLANTAELLGHNDDAEEFRHLASRIRAGFNSAYVEKGRIASDCTTVYTLAIVFNLLDDGDRDAAGTRLAELVADSDYRISTGFAGTPFVMDALSSTGHISAAGRLLLQRECPSWLYPVTMGATTIWERWDSMLPDGTINPGEMTSFNHYALGAVADWMHRVLGGIAPLKPGYRQILIAPRPIEGIDWVETSLDTPNGRVSVRWERISGAIRLTADVPEGASAVIRLGDRTETTGAGRHVLEIPEADIH